MIIALRIIMLAALAAIGFWLWTVLFPTPEKIVLKNVSGLASAATLKAGTGNFERAGKVSSLIGYFSIDAQITIDVMGAGQLNLNGRDEIREAAGRALLGLQSLKVKFLDATAKVSLNQNNAEVNCTAEVQINGSQDLSVQELKFEFQKIEKDWLITRIESVKTLQ